MGLGNLLPRRFTHVDTGRRFQLLDTWASPQGFFSVCDLAIGSPRVSDPRKSKAEVTMSL